MIMPRRENTNVMDLLLHIFSFVLDEVSISK